MSNKEHEDENVLFTEQQFDFFVDDFYNQLQQEMGNILIGDNNEEFLEQCLGYIADKFADDVSKEMKIKDFKKIVTEKIKQNINFVCNQIILNYVNTLSEEEEQIKVNDVFKNKLN